MNKPLRLKPISFKETANEMRQHMEEYEKRCALAFEKDYLEASGWVSVKDRLPEESECVLVASNLDDNAYIDYWFNEDNPTWRYTSVALEKVQYWMELPDIPRVEKLKEISFKPKNQRCSNLEYVPLTSDSKTILEEERF